MGKQANTPLKGPWELKKDEINNYIPVTVDNIKHAKRLGQIFYVITGSTFRGAFSIDPCFLKGWWRVQKKPWESGYPGHHRTFFPEDQNYDEYNASYKAMFEKYLQEGSLFIKQSDPILKYIKE